MQRFKSVTRRRDLLRFAIAGAGVAAANSALPAYAAAVPFNSEFKRKARYQANSPEVQNFYRVNKYPAR